MYVKFPLGDLNPDPYFPHHTSTYTYEMTITPKICDGQMNHSLYHFYLHNSHKS